jgi:hypothetical protein
MPEQERVDFNFYWNESMLDENSATKNPGGDFENGGVDYNNNLIPWCKGNSISVDQTTLKEPRDLISLLVTNYKNGLYKLDSGLIRNIGGRPPILDHTSGVNFNDIKEKLRTEPFARMTRKGNLGAGQVHPRYFRLEKILQVLLVDAHISLFSTESTLHSGQASIIKKIRIDAKNGGIATKQSQLYICNELHNGKNRNCHIRLSRKKGWEVYIRDRFGSPSSLKGFVPGNMSSEGQMAEPKTMRYDLHTVFAECIARSFSARGEWGRNQSKIQRKISDMAIDGDGTTISLDDYYITYSQNSAAHMADYFLQRSIGNLSSANFELLEVDGSDPKSWKVAVDPDLIRWRGRSRDRERER